MVVIFAALVAVLAIVGWVIAGLTGALVAWGLGLAFVVVVGIVLPALD